MPKGHFDIIECVQQTYWNYLAYLINRMWLTHQCCMNEIIASHGDNDWKIPHMEREKLECQGQLPLVIGVTEQARPFLEGNGAISVQRGFPQDTLVLEYSGF